MKKDPESPEDAAFLDLKKEFEQLAQEHDSHVAGFVELFLTKNKHSVPIGYIRKLLRRFQPEEMTQYLFGETFNHDVDNSIFEELLEAGKLSKNFIKEHVVRHADKDTKVYLLRRYREYRIGKQKILTGTSKRKRAVEATTD